MSSQVIDSSLGRFLTNSSHSLRRLTTPRTSVWT